VVPLSACDLLARIKENQALCRPLFQDFTSFASNPKFYCVSYIMGHVSVWVWECLSLGKPRKAEARLWAMLSFFVAMWFFGRLMIIRSASQDTAFFWQAGHVSWGDLFKHRLLSFVLEFIDKGGGAKNAARCRILPWPPFLSLLI